MKKITLITSVFLVLVFILTAVGISGYNPVLAQFGSTVYGEGQMSIGIASSVYFPFIWQNPIIIPTPTCSNIIVNSGFEDIDGWVLPITEFTAAYSMEKPRNGDWSLRTGIVPPASPIYSYSSGQQQVKISSSATSAKLSMWVFPISSETNLTLAAPELTIGEPIDTQSFSGDFQYILVLDQYGNLIESLDVGLNNSQTWTHLSFDLEDYIGWYPIKIHFGTYNDWLGGVSAMFVDDVTLVVCTE